MNVYSPRFTLAAGIALSLGLSLALFAMSGRADTVPQDVADTASQIRSTANEAETALSDGWLATKVESTLMNSSNVDGGIKSVQSKGLSI